MANLHLRSPPALSPSIPTAPRLHFIDGLRGLAMLMVLLFHCAINSNGWDVPGHLLEFVSYGYLGVNLFLVLSGFCLYWPFVHTPERREPTLFQFAKKRCRRILPPYYAALLFFWLFLLLDVTTHHHFHEDATTLTHVFLSLGWHLLMLHNLRPEYLFSINGVFWSLALEFSLYILFPVLVEAFRRFGPWLPSLIVLAGGLAWRLTVATQIGSQATRDESFVLHNCLPSYCFEFVAGMIAAWALARQHRMMMEGADSVERQRVQKMGPSCNIILVIVGAAAVWTTQGSETVAAFSDALWGICFACLLVAAGQPEGLLHRVLSTPALVRLGIFSYSVYLIHLPLTKALDGVIMQHHLPPVPFGLGVIVPLMLGLGYLFHLKFERPFMGSPRPAPESSRLAAVPTVESKTEA